MIYADYNATAPLRPEARAAMIAAMDVGANPSSVHAPGRQARKILETARVQVANAVRGLPQDIVFTSGGTEAISLAIGGIVKQLEAKCTLLVSAIEHEAAAKNAGYSGAPTRTVYVDANGQIDLNQLQETLDGWDEDASGKPVLVLMLVNNETGVIQPVADAAARVRAAGGIVVCDAVQALGKIDLNVSLLGVDYLALSAHKVGGPQGSGALWIKGGSPLKPIIHGGGQERSLRSVQKTSLASLDLALLPRRASAILHVSTNCRSGAINWKHA
jgi:cysteine desulfurase